MSNVPRTGVRYFVPALYVFAAAMLTATLIYLMSDNANSLELCGRNLRQLHQALWEYHDRNGTFPPAYRLGKDNKTEVSWRVLILPYLGRQDLFDAYAFDEPWDGPNNSRLIAQMPDVFRCPGASKRPKGRTSYVAVVGSQTMWPGDQAVAVNEISAADGAANTVCLIEIDDSDIAWTEPRDLLLRDLVPPGEDRAGVRYSSPHKDGVQVLFADGSVRKFKKPITETRHRQYLLSYLTAWGGRPYQDKWLAGEDELTTANFPPEINADKLAATDVTPHLQSPIISGRNAIYCATFQIAWEDLRDQYGIPEVEGNPAIAAVLNNSRFSRSALSTDCFVAQAGLIREGVREKILKEMHQKFPAVTPALRQSAETDVVAFAFLQKNLSFQARFDLHSQPLVFHSETDDVRVASFGFKEYASASGSRQVLSEQTNVLHYASPDEFIIRLKPKNDEIVLAKVNPHATLAETLAAVTTRIRDHSDNVERLKLQDKDELAIPRLAFNIERFYSELLGRHVRNIANGEARFTEARQSVRLLLNETGARIESEVDVGIYLNGHSAPAPPPPRRFVFDKPFLMYLKESQADQPYLVLWVSNLEIMERKE